MYLRKVVVLMLLLTWQFSSVVTASEISTRIINGVESNADKWPFMVSLVVKNREVQSGHFCGASFIGGRYILTAAHCVEDKEASDLDAVISISSLIQNDAENHRHSLKNIYVHPDYISAETGSDIAILELSNELNYTKADLADRYLRNNLASGDLLTVMGWGDQNPDRDARLFKNELYQVDVPLVSQAECLAQDGYQNIMPDAFCAGYKTGGYDSCQGDSGGPIMAKTGNTYEQLGIVSWGIGCAEPGNYGVYTNVSFFSQWIAANTQNLSYQQSEFIGAKPLGHYTHTFQVENLSEQDIAITSVQVSRSSAVVAKNTCSAIPAKGSCEIAVSYTVDKIDFDSISIDLDSNLADLEKFTMKAFYLGAKTASNELKNVIKVGQEALYSSNEPWVIESESINSPRLSDNESSQLMLTGLASGQLSFDADISTEPNFDRFNIYLNGHLYKHMSGVEAKSVTINLPRHDNTVILEYKKDGSFSTGRDSVTITNFIHSKHSEAVVLGNDTSARKGASSGGSAGVLLLISLSLLLCCRSQYKQ